MNTNYCLKNIKNIDLSATQQMTYCFEEYL